MSRRTHVITSKRVPGYTLVELIISLMLFSTILGTLFAALGGLRRTENFRNTVFPISQGGNSAIEATTRSLKQGNASMFLVSHGSCVEVKGFYLADAAGNPIISYSGQSVVSTTINNASLVALVEEAYTTPSQAVAYRWVRQRYERVRSTVANEKGSYPMSLVEYRDYVVSNDHVWPKPLSSCAGQQIVWQNAETRVLTSSLVDVTDLKLTVLPPVVRSSTLLGSPFATISLTLTHSFQSLKPLTLTTTVVPPFLYGGLRNVDFL